MAFIVAHHGEIENSTKINIPSVHIKFEISILRFPLNDNLINYDRIKFFKLENTLISTNPKQQEQKIRPIKFSCCKGAQCIITINIHYSSTKLIRL